jgi:hypothetical protein
MPLSKTSKPKQKALPASPLVRPGTKLSNLLELMSRPQGATVEEIAAANKWQKHTVRGAISGVVKKKLRQRVKLLTQGDRRAYALTKPAATKAAK